MPQVIDKNVFLKVGRLIYVRLFLSDLAAVLCGLPVTAKTLANPRHSVTFTLQHPVPIPTLNLPVLTV